MLQYIYKIEGGIAMISYKPLLIILVKKDLNLTQLKDGIKVSSSTIAKIKKNQYISTKVIDDICNFLDCKIEDVIEHIKIKWHLL